MKPLKGMYFDLNKKRSLGGELAIFFLQSFVGKKIFGFFLKRFPEFFVGYFSSIFHYELEDKYTDENLEKFEDLYWLFTSTIMNRGILRMDFDEAAYIFKLASSLKNANLLEIGRYEGGSIILLATAIDKNSKITSIDINPKNDTALKKVLGEAKLDNKVELIIDNANNVKAEPNKYNLIFIDGDHSYQGVKKDYEHWRIALRPKGHLIFHDSAHSREFSSWAPGVGKLVEEIDQRGKDYLTKVKEIGSITHFVKTEKPFN